MQFRRIYVVVFKSVESGSVFDEEVRFSLQEKPAQLRQLERSAGPIPDEFHKAFAASNKLPAGCTAQTASKLLAAGTIAE